MTQDAIAHTAGPWHVVPMEPIWIEDANRRTVACIRQDGRSLSARLANAALIAAAPDLLLALRCLYDETADYMQVNKLGDPATKQNMRLARAALDMATLFTR